MQVPCGDFFLTTIYTQFSLAILQRCERYMLSPCLTSVFLLLCKINVYMATGIASFLSHLKSSQMYTNRLDFSTKFLNEISHAFQTECNTYACRFDGFDCTNQLQPFSNCTAIAHGHRCHALFKDGTCNPACNSEECLYDGFDCVAPVTECSAFYDVYCRAHFANGHCDAGCDSPACLWDGGDCAAEAPRLGDGALILILLIPPTGMCSIYLKLI